MYLSRREKDNNIILSFSEMKNLNNFGVYILGQVQVGFGSFSTIFEYLFSYCWSLQIPSTTGNWTEQKVVINWMRMLKWNLWSEQKQVYNKI